MSASLCTPPMTWRIMMGLPIPIAIATAAESPFRTAISPTPIAAMMTPNHTTTR